MTDFDEFDEFDEFEQPSQQTEQPAADKRDLAKEFPQCKALVEDLRASFPELFAGAKVIHMVEGETGLEHSTREYRLASQFTPLSARSFFELGRLHRLSASSAAKRGSSNKRAKYVIVPGYVTSRTDGDRHYITAPRLADLYRVNFQECRVFVPTGDPGRDEATWKQFKQDGYVFLRPDFSGKYQLPDGKSNDR